MEWVFLTVVALVAALLGRVLWVLRKVRRRRGFRLRTGSGGSVRTMLVLGSGGHTAELTRLFESCDRAVYRPLVFVVAATDTTSRVRALRHEQAVGNEANCAFETIPRSREVGQSWLTTVASTAYACVVSLVTVARHRPQLIVTNGPGTCVPVCFSAFLLHVLGVVECKIVFVESFCRVTSLSLSGKLVYPIASRFIVHWPQLCEDWPAAEYPGQLF